MAVVPRGGAAPASARTAIPWRWLDPPTPLGTLTALHPAAAEDADDRGRRVREWAEGVWGAYETHHGEVRGWVDALLQ